MNHENVLFHQHPSQGITDSMRFVVNPESRRGQVGFCTRKLTSMMSETNTRDWNIRFPYDLNFWAGIGHGVWAPEVLEGWSKFKREAKNKRLQPPRVRDNHGLLHKQSQIRLGRLFDARIPMILISLQRLWTRANFSRRHCALII